MDKFTRDQVSRVRKILGNPYALSEYLDEFAPSTLGITADRQPVIASHSSNSTITFQGRNEKKEHTHSRLGLLQNPYAYLNEEDTYSSCELEQKQELRGDSKSDQKAHKKPSPPTDRKLLRLNNSQKYSDQEIKVQVKKLHSKLWKDKEKIWGSNPPNDPVDLLDPFIALEINGYTVDIKDTLGQFRQGHKTIEVAGLLDNTNKKVELSRQFKSEVFTFTAAHELGHALLHGNSNIGLHRDRPQDGTSLSRDHVEWAADKFATHFLMPEKLLRKHFSQRFLTELFQLSEDTAFALSSCSISEIKNKFRSNREFSRFLASTEQYNGQRFISLASRFKVSIETMAIRLEELKLFKFI